MNKTNQPIDTDADSKAILELTIASLKLGKPIARFSLILMLISIFCIIMASFTQTHDIFFGIAFLSLLLSVAIQYWALRARLDTNLFQMISQSENLPETLQQLDNSLIKLKMKSPKLVFRSLDERCISAMKLMKKLIIATSLHFLMFLFLLFVFVATH